MTSEVSDFDKRATQLYRRLIEIVDGHDGPATVEEITGELTPEEALMFGSYEFTAWLARHAHALGVRI